MPTSSTWRVCSRIAPASRCPDTSSARPGSAPTQCDRARPEQRSTTDVSNDRPPAVDQPGDSVAGQPARFCRYPAAARRPGARHPRPAGHPGADRRAEPAAAPRPAGVAALPGLAGRVVHRRPGLLHIDPGLGERPAQRPDLRLACAAGGGCGDQYPGRAGTRRVERGAARARVGPGGVGGEPGDRRAARVRDRYGADRVAVHHGAAAVPLGHHGPAGSAGVVGTGAAGAAGTHPGAGGHAVHRPDDAGDHERGAGQRLCRDGPAEGAAGAGGDRPARVPARDRAGGPGDRAAAGLAGRGRSGGGVPVPLPGRRPGADRRGEQAGHRGGAGDHPVHRRRLHRGQPARRRGRHPGQPPATHPRWDAMSETIAVPLSAEVNRPAGLIRRAWAFPQAKIGAVLTVVVVLLAVLGPLVAEVLTGYAPDGFAGTDNIGRDVLSRFLDGGLTLLFYAVLATALGVLLGAALGMLAAYTGGRLDAVIMRGGDVLLSFPCLVLALLAIAVIGPRGWLLVLVIGISHAPRIARVTRQATLTVAGQDYIRAAEMYAVPRWRILLDETLPNITGPLLVEVGLRLTYSIGYVASLSFLGLGIQPPAADWGLMINENRFALVVEPWGVLLPVLAIAVLTGGTNMITDSLASAASGARQGSES